MLDLITRSRNNIWTSKQSTQHADSLTLPAPMRTMSTAMNPMTQIENEKAIILASDILTSYLSIVLCDDEKGHVAKYIEEPQGEAEQ